jgi:mono/diheme cytochrome c family protein
VYADTCAACHGDDGGGVARLYPALRDSAVVQAPEPATLLRLLLLGGQAAATDAAPTGPAMPAFHWKLDDARVAAVLTFIRNAWGNAAAPVDAASVRDARPGLLRQAAE